MAKRSAKKLDQRPPTTLNPELAANGVVNQVNPDGQAWFFRHPLVRRQFFSALPRRLLDLVKQYVKPVPWDQGARHVEFHAADECDKRPVVVGFWDGSPLLNSDLLPQLPLPKVSMAEAKSLGWDWNQKEMNERLQVAQIRLDYFANVARGYSGWLVTNAQFQEEQANLIKRWSRAIAQSGLSGVGQLISAGGPASLPGVVTSTPDDRQEFTKAVREFLVRWRLNELTAPNLPAPAKPLLSGKFPYTVSQHLMDIGGVFHIPDTFPIPSRDELRALLDEVLHFGSNATHLHEWQSIVSARNSAKNQIDKYGRIRQLYHYWALLHDRYASSLKRKNDRLHLVFSRFFSVNDDTVRSDLRLIGQRLGQGWATRACFRIPTNQS